jgi:sugar phosphate isomerase/epimerase
MRVAVDGIYFGRLQGLSGAQFAELTAAAGAEGVNWPFAEGYAQADDPGSWERCAELLGAKRLSVVSLAAATQNSAIAGEEEGYRAEILAMANAAPVLGSKLIDCWPRMAEGASKPESQRVLGANVQAVAGALEAAGIAISFEFEPGTAVERYAESLEALASLPPCARLTADTYHINRAGDDLIAAAHAMGDRLGILHISGSHRGEPGSAGDTCDHEGFVRAAREAGYAGDLVLQYAPPEEVGDSLKRAVELCRGIVERTA